MTPVIVVGPVFMDIIMAEMDRLPASGEEIHAHSASWAPGGYAISATAFSRMGLSTQLVTELGDDALGMALEQKLLADGVQVISPPAVGRTNIAVSLNWNGDRGIVSYTQPFHNPFAALETILPDQDGLVLLAARHPFARDIARAAREHHLTVAMMLSWQPDFLTSRALPQLFPWTDILLCNVPEALLATGQTDFQRALYILGESISNVVITRGAEGAVALVDGEYAEAAAAPCVIVDATGAGDVFAAGYLTAQLRGLPLVERLQIGNWAAAQTVAALGGSTSAPTWQEVEEFLRMGVSPSWRKA